MDLINELLQRNLIDQQTANLIARQLNREQYLDVFSTEYLDIIQTSFDELLQGIGERDQIISLQQFETIVDEEWNQIAQRAVPQIADLSQDLTALKLSNFVDEEDILDAFNQINDTAVQFINDYYLSDDLGSMPQLNITTKNDFRPVFNSWLNGDLGDRGLPDLIDNLTPVVGETRSRAVAVTETTRIFGNVSRIIADELPFDTGLRWDTSQDEVTCPTCEPLDGLIIPSGQTEWTHPELGSIEHPAHVHCRCDLTPVTL